MMGASCGARFPTDLDIGFVHDWLPIVGGAEKLLASLAEMSPGAPIYTLFDFLSDEDRTALFNTHPIHVSALNRLPAVRRYYRGLLLACMRSIEAFDVSRHDLVLSSSAALAKGVITHAEQTHIAYVHSPARYAWDMTHEYLASIAGPFSGLKRALAHEMLHRFRKWDFRTGAGPDLLIANSEFIRRRIEHVYRREAAVIFPPVDITGFSLNDAPREGAFLTASRLVSFKRVDLIVQAFSARPELRLDVAGDGPELARLKRLAGPNIRFLGHLRQNRLAPLMQNARAFVCASREDFGIAALEAQACGTPVIGPGFGGTAETIVPPEADSAPTGLHFPTQSIAALSAALSRFEEIERCFDPAQCRRNAERFSQSRFQDRMALAIELSMSQGSEHARKLLAEEAQDRH